MTRILGPGKLLVVFALFALAFVALLAVGCGGDDGEKDSGEPAAELFVDPAAPVVDVSLKEFSIALSQDEGKAGSITFAAKNTGVEIHEMVLVKTDVAADKLVATNGKVDEEAVGELVGEIEDLESGHTAATTFDLAPGNYVFLCNIAGHYELGMHTGFTVE
ncbi:MAG: sulfocyanin-like copper-binding protein [Dehalococcoidia bacterium]|nr:sulfocyanin-like copper-binding protein [Dehalococcoidia bacterium]